MNYVRLGACTAMLLFALSSAANTIKPKIVGGTEAEPNEFPYIVSLHASYGHICGGSLIAPNWVLTAAHCVSGSSPQRVYIGLHDQRDKSGAEVIGVKTRIRHPQYNRMSMDYDFALLELERSSSYPWVDINTEELAISDEPGQEIMSTTAGWGETRQSMILGAADRLQKVDVPLVSHETCSNAYPRGVTERMICAGYPEGQKDACYGDSGGPLIVRDAEGVVKLVGVVSWGEGCARPNKYGVYSKVNAVVDWIQETVQ